MPTPAATTLPPGQRPPPTVWRPRRSRAGQAAPWTAAGLAALALLGWGLTAWQPPGVGLLVGAAVSALLSAAAGGALALAAGYRRLSYALGPDALRITWLGQAYQVPYAAIEGIYGGKRLGLAAGPAWRRGLLAVAGGIARVEDLGTVHFFTTRGGPSSLILVTMAREAVALSPGDLAGFRAALIERIQEGDDAPPGQDEAMMRVASLGVPWSALHDRWMLPLVALGAVLLLGVLAAISLPFDRLPDVVSLRFDAAGVATDLAPKAELLRLPLVGLLIVLGNLALGTWIHSREPLLARLMWATATVLQGMLLVGVVRLLP